MVFIYVAIVVSTYIVTVVSIYSGFYADPGACFLCPGCPSDRSEGVREDGMDCSGRPRAEGSAACVETTAYALLALREVEGGDQFTVCLAQWLLKIRGNSGGFYSSQVC